MAADHPRPAVVRPAGSADVPSWLAMRQDLWPDCPEPEQRSEIEAQLAGDRPWQTLVAEASDGRLLGFVELALRERAEGCTTGPVGYLEGWYVVPEVRRLGIGAALVRAAETWTRTHGCTELASDTDPGNEVSRSAHLRLGFEPTAHPLRFRKGLR